MSGGVRETLREVASNAVPTWLANTGGARTRAAYEIADALLPVVERVVAEAEQRGREDNADHGMCYVHGSKALERVVAEARAEALREVEALLPGFEADYGIQSSPVARLRAVLRQAGGGE